jgi:hypothetical protein
VAATQPVKCVLGKQVTCRIETFATMDASAATISLTRFVIAKQGNFRLRKPHSADESHDANVRANSLAF